MGARARANAARKARGSQFQAMINIADRTNSVWNTVVKNWPVCLARHEPRCREVLPTTEAARTTRPHYCESAVKVRL